MDADSRGMCREARRVQERHNSFISSPRAAMMNSLAGCRRSASVGGRRTSGGGDFVCRSIRGRWKRSSCNRRRSISVARAPSSSIGSIISESKALITSSFSALRVSRSSDQDLASEDFLDLLDGLRSRKPALFLAASGRVWSTAHASSATVAV